MSPVFGSHAGAAAVQAAGPVVTHSLDLPGTVADFLQQVCPNVPTSDKICTISLWFKTPDLVSQKTIISTGSATTDTDTDMIQHLSATGGTMQLALSNDGKRRTSTNITAEAWHHICAGMNTSLPTEPPRATFEIDLVDVTTLQGTIAPDTLLNWMKQGMEHVIGHRYRAGAREQVFQGKVAEVHIIDGQKLPGSSFAVNDGGTIKAKNYTGTFGNNGSLLKFQNAGVLGENSAPGGLDWTTVGTGLSQSTDIPPTL